MDDILDRFWNVVWRNAGGDLEQLGVREQDIRCVYDLGVAKTLTELAPSENPKWSQLWHEVDRSIKSRQG